MYCRKTSNTLHHAYLGQQVFEGWALFKAILQRAGSLKLSLHWLSHRLVMWPALLLFWWNWLKIKKYLLLLLPIMMMMIVMIIDSQHLQQFVSRNLSRSLLALRSMHGSFAPQITEWWNVVNDDHKARQNNKWIVRSSLRLTIGVTQSTVR